MKKAELIDYLNKKIKIVLTNQFRYSGRVIDVTDTSLVILDKFNSRVTINPNDIIVITEMNGGDQNGH